jgi:inosine/xanthosine triphosphatase
VKIVVASENPVKIEAVQRGFARMFPDSPLELKGVSVPSGVSDQPMTDEETLRGAKNRAFNARQAVPSADYWIGIEGGVHETGDAFLVFAWAFILSQDRNGYARSGAFVLPDEVARLVCNGIELGDADDAVFGRDNSKQANGAVGLLTNDIIDRAEYYAHTVVLALIPFVNANLTFLG